MSKLEKPFIEIRDLSKQFPLSRKETFTAVHPFNLTIYKGETVGLVGESGSGKTTVGKLLLRLIPPTSGSILFDNTELLSLSNIGLKSMRRRMQMIFQDPYASLNPRMSVEEIIGEPLDIHRLAVGEHRKNKIYDLLHLVGLNSSHAQRFPHEFSGGQRQRIGIARALALNPEFLICDEPISALDVSIQAQIINLLKELRQKFELTYLFIAHDLAMVKYLSDRVAVMNRGHLVELAETEALYHNARHPYTQLLLSSIPVADPQVRKQKLPLLSKEEPLADFKREGCPFASRCPLAHAPCHQTMPPLKQISSHHFVACHAVSKIYSSDSERHGESVKKEGPKN